jgi:hypothetical protein
MTTRGHNFTPGNDGEDKYQQRKRLQVLNVPSDDDEEELPDAYWSDTESKAIDGDP